MTGNIAILGYGLSAIGPGVGIGLIFAAYIQGVARQPEAQGRLQTIAFILVNNLFGIIPPIQFPTLSRIGFPIALTLIVYVVYHAVGVRRFGVVGYLKHMIPPGVPGWVLGILVPLEFLTYFFTRPVTLALRIWGNMFAGHLLLVLFITGGEWFIFESGKLGYIPLGLFSYVFAFVMTIFEGLIEFLETYIFILLTALYIAGSLAEEH